MNAARLETLAAEARAIATELFGDMDDGCSQAKGSPSCVQLEHDRPLTKAEKAKGWYARGFADLDTSRMCRTCEAYFHAERTAQILHEAHCWAVRIEMEEQRKTVGAP